MKHSEPNGKGMHSRANAYPQDLEADSGFRQMNCNYKTNTIAMHDLSYMYMSGVFLNFFFYSQAGLVKQNFD